MVGQTVGKYRILDRIGRGSMGTVYRAEDKSLHRDVAIKVLNADLNDPAAGRRFRAEAIAVARLNHPGIAKVYDLFEHDGQWLMAMEFVNGETLESLVTRGGPLSAEQAADLGSQALAALAHAHGMGVVHRDLKPANLMVADGRLKIMDFGIARVAGTEHLTSAGLRMGTPAYMAPEQVLGQDIDARTDIFAMGCVLFFLATGTLPFKGETAMELVQARLQDHATPARTARHDLPAWFGQVVDRALARLPANRFQTADEFYLAIERGLSGLPIEMPPSPMDASNGFMETMLPGAMPVVPAPAPAPAGGPGESGARPIAASDPTVMTPSRGRDAVAGTPASAFAASAPPAPLPAAKPASANRTGLIVGVVAAIAAIVGAYMWLRPSDTSSPAAPAAATSPVASASPSPAATVTPDPAATVAPITPASTPASTATPTATVAATPGPASTAGAGTTPAPGRRGGLTDAPVSFDTVKLLKVTGRRGEDVDATLTLGGVTIVLAPREGTPVVMPYKSLIGATFIKDRDPRWNSNLASPPADLDLPGGLLRRRSTRNWLVLQGQAAYLILTLADSDAEQVLKILSDRTRVKIDRPSVPK